MSTARSLIAPPAPLSRRAAWIAVAGLTVLAAVVRFAWLDRPCLWGDEALVYMRTCGTYAQLLVPLKVDGFTPLHYETVRRVGHGFDLDVWVPWTVPAAAAVLAAVASLAALRTKAPGLHPALLWAAVAAAVAAVLWQLVGPAVHWVHFGHVRYGGTRLTPRVLRSLPASNGTLLVPAVYFLARQLLPRRPAVLAAAFVAASGFAVFYSRDAKMYMNCWTPATAGVGCVLWWLRSGRATAWLGWVAASSLAAGFHASALVLVGLSSLFLLTHKSLRLGTAALWLAGAAVIAAGPVGYYTTFNLWVDRVEADGWRDSGLSWVPVYNYHRTGPELARYAGTTFLTGWEWPRPDDLPSFRRDHPARVAVPMWIATALAVAVAAGLLPWPRRWQGWRADADGTAEPPWRVGLWLGLWVVVPMYGFYCRSGGDFAPPAAWWHAAAGPLTAADLVGWNPWTWPGWVTSPLFVVACIAVAMRRTWAERGWVVPVMFAGVVTFGLSIPLYAAQHGAASGGRLVAAAVLCVPLWFALRPVPAGWKTVVLAAWAWALVGLPLAVYVGLAFWFRQHRGPAVRAVVAAAVVAAIFGSCDLVYRIAVPLATAAADAGQPWQSVWVPRYMGVVWPAVAVGVAVLVTRLPTRPVRWAVVAVLFGFNGYVGWHRVFGGTEPPVDRMAADAVAAQGSATHLAWFDLGTGRGDPGRGNLLSLPGRYYLQQLRRDPAMTPAIFRGPLFDYDVNRGQVANGTLPRLVARTPTADHLVVWEQSAPDPPRPPETLVARLPSGWHLTDERWFDVVQAWDWMGVGRYCRREYTRQPPEREQIAPDGNK